MEGGSGGLKGVRGLWDTVLFFFLGGHTVECGGGGVEIGGGFERRKFGGGGCALRFDGGVWRDLRTALTEDVEMTML